MKIANETTGRLRWTALAEGASADSADNGSIEPGGQVLKRRRRSMHGRVILPSLAILVLLAMLVTSSALAEDGSIHLEASLAPTKASYGVKDPVTVRFTLTNKHGEQVHVVQRDTPLAGAENESIAIELDGKSVPYLGRYFKRGPLVLDDWLTLAPGESKSAVVDLAEFHHFRQAGQYTATVDIFLTAATGERDSSLLKPDSKRLIRMELTTKPVTVGIAKGRPAPKVSVLNPYDGSTTPDNSGPDLPTTGEEDSGGLPTVEGSNTFSDCNPTQRTRITQARQNALLIAHAAWTRLRDTPFFSQPGDTLYARWFGAYDNGRWSEAERNMMLIRSALLAEDFEFHCDCSTNDYAWVWPWRPYNVHLCNLFWTSPATGDNSKAGTVFHEASHFWAVTGLGDKEYGNCDCMNLASAKPKKALKNADSHEYFAEPGTICANP